MDWYALFIHQGREEEVQRWLNYHFDPSVLYSFVPKRKLREKRNGVAVDVVKTMYPGYIFVKTEMDVDKYYLIRSIPHLIRVLGHNTYCSKIDEKEMDVVLQLTKHSNIIDYSRIIVENSKVKVVGGPLLGLEGLIKKINKHKRRATILLTLLSEERLVDVGIEFLSSVF